MEGLKNHLRMLIDGLEQHQNKEQVYAYVEALTAACEAENNQDFLITHKSIIQALIKFVKKHPNGVLLGYCHNIVAKYINCTSTNPILAEDFDYLERRCAEIFAKGGIKLVASHVI